MLCQCSRERPPVLTGFPSKHTCGELDVALIASHILYDAKSYHSTDHDGTSVTKTLKQQTKHQKKKVKLTGFGGALKSRVGAGLARSCC